MKTWLVNVSKAEATLLIANNEINEDLIVVEANTVEEAIKIAKRRYDANKRALSRRRLEKENRCSCGRAKDRFRPDGVTLFKTCTVCHVRSTQKWKPNSRSKIVAKRLNSEFVPVARNEPARVESNLERQRDRRAELRIETLLEVQKAWQSSYNNGKFTAWLKEQIRECLHASEIKKTD